MGKDEVFPGRDMTEPPVIELPYWLCTVSYALGGGGLFLLARKEPITPNNVVPIRAVPIFSCPYMTRIVPLMTNTRHTVKAIQSAVIFS